MPTGIAIRNFSNTAPVTNLTANIDNQTSTQNIPVTSTGGFPAVPFTACMDRNTPSQEFVLVTTIIGANNFGVVRGYDGTSAVAHSGPAGPPPYNPATFEHTTGAIDYREANWHHTDNTRDDHQQYANLNGSRAFTGLQAFSAGISAPTLALSGNPGSNVATRYVGGTGPTALGPPGAGTFLVGDWIRDIAGVEWTCMVAGTPGTWVPEPGRLVARYINPGAPHNISNTTYTVVSQPFTFVKNIQYVIDVRIQGTVEIALPQFINSIVSVSQSMTTIPSIMIVSLATTALTVGGLYGGGITTALNIPANTVAGTITVVATSHGSGSWQLASDACELVVRRA